MTRADVAVVGAGPAGIAAALAAADSGAATLLIDENSRVGGQLNWRIMPTLEADPGFGIGPAPGPVYAEHLRETLESSENLTVRTNTVAWGLFEDNLLGISDDRAAEEVSASAIVIATGSTDIAAPFPGWTLPGVMTARAVQIFVHIHRVLPGQRWAILGETAEAAELREDLERVGARVVVERAPAETFRASGTNRLAHVEDGAEVYEVDSLALALGRQPDPELALQAMVDSCFVEQLGGFTILRDQDCETSVQDIYVAGDAAGIGTLPELVAEGTLAGLAAAGADAGTLANARATLSSVSTRERAEAIARVRHNSTSAR